MVNVDLAMRENGTVEIRDVLGKLIYSYDFRASTAESMDVDLSGPGAGMYFVTLITGNNRIAQKVIVR
jgi:hypothetical protein